MDRAVIKTKFKYYIEVNGKNALVTYRWIQFMMLYGVEFDDKVQV